MNIFEQVKEVIAKRVSNEILAEINLMPQSKLIDDLDFDSLSFIQLLVDIEDKFNIEIDEVDLQGELTVSGLIKVIEKNM